MDAQRPPDADGPVRLGADPAVGSRWAPSATESEQDAAARRARLGALQAVRRARDDVAEAEATLARDTGAADDGWWRDAEALERIHNELVAARRTEHRPFHHGAGADVVGLELAERLVLERLGLTAYEDLDAARSARRRAVDQHLVIGDADVVVLDDQASVELATVELEQAQAHLDRLRSPEERAAEA
jgi:hypothetical protein